MLLEPFTKEQEDDILSEVGYTREKLQTDLEYIKEWLKKQHHLPPSRLKETDSFLQFFLTGCKGNLEKVKKKLDSYYTYRSHSELYNCRDPLDPQYLDRSRTFSFCALPQLPKNKLVRIIALALGDHDSKKFDMINYSKKLISFGELRLRLDGLSIRDFLVVDCAGASISHLLKVKPFILRDLAIIGQDIFPFRFIMVLYINTPSFVEVAINNLVKPLLTKKLKKRIMITSGGYEEVYKYLDKGSLTKDFGGDIPSSLKELSDNWHEKEIAERDWYVNDLSERTDESKRISRGDTMKNPFLGFAGSLKKLVID